ncbi:MAG TPA: hypothetical protein VEQ18_06020, partial [Candidatus Nitrosocosmicus sp.]|nr:hypothetical protein [Candidatus Nitrosocosmicus sp.]
AKTCLKTEHLRAPKFTIVLRSHHKYTYTRTQHTHITNTGINPNESSLMKSKSIGVQKYSEFITR